MTKAERIRRAAAKRGYADLPEDAQRPVLAELAAKYETHTQAVLKALTSVPGGVGQPRKPRCVCPCCGNSHYQPRKPKAPADEELAKQ